MERYSFQQDFRAYWQCCEMDDWKASSVVGVLLFPMWTPLTVVSNDVESLAILGWNRLCCPTAILLMTIPIYMGPIVQGSTVDWCLWWVVQTGQINKQQNLSLTFLEHRGSNLMYRDFFQRIFLAYIGSSIVIFLRNYLHDLLDAQQFMRAWVWLPSRGALCHLLFWNKFTKNCPPCNSI